MFLHKAGFADDVTFMMLLFYCPQSLCEDVFQGFSPKLPSGLLRDPPADIRQDLYDALEACAYPDNHLERHATRQRTPDIAVKKLEEIIRFGLKYS